MRADLLALSPESLVLFANLGLVKRAQKELESGIVPSLEEDASGAVVATSRDGATTRLPPATPLKNTLCSCGASGACRHRIAAVLAYQRLHANAAQAVSAPWDPGSITDTTLETYAGSSVLARARAALAAPLVVGVEHGAIPVARLPTATVQFTVPDDLTHARCDCALGHKCEHVVLAVWAFRRAASVSSTVELGAPRAGVSASDLTPIEVELEGVVARGLVEHGSAESLERARAAADRLGFLWLADALTELERQRAAYDKKSARFSSRTCSRLVAEIAARLRAARAAPEESPLHARFVLGADEARETLTAELRLTALGVRVEADGAARSATLYFADHDGKQVLVLRKDWPPPTAGKPKDGFDLGELYASSRLTLSSLARGDLVARAALRRANGEVDLSAARGLKSSVLPGELAWADLPSPLRITDLRAFDRTLHAEPPAFLSPRRIGREIHVIALGRVIDVAYRRGEQTLLATLEDPAGSRFTLQTTHRSVSPGAIDATLFALERSPRYVSGELTRTRAGFTLAPLAFLADRLIVPDLEKSRACELPPTDTPTLDPLTSLLEELDALVDRAILKGADAPSRAERDALSHRLDDAGLPRTALVLRSAANARAMLDLTLLAAVLELSSADAP
ncbi:MAG: SWIM zinc finger family protein [Polyangiaceae bacterium]